MKKDYKTILMSLTILLISFIFSTLSYSGFSAKLSGNNKEDMIQDTAVNKDILLNQMENNIAEESPTNIGSENNCKTRSISVFNSRFNICDKTMMETNNQQEKFLREISG